MLEHGVANLSVCCNCTLNGFRRYLGSLLLSSLSSSYNPSCSQTSSSVRLTLRLPPTATGSLSLDSKGGRRRFFTLDSIALHIGCKSFSDSTINKSGVDGVGVGCSCIDDTFAALIRVSSANNCFFLHSKLDVESEPFEGDAPLLISVIVAPVVPTLSSWLSSSSLLRGGGSESPVEKGSSATRRRAEYEMNHEVIDSDDGLCSTHRSNDLNTIKADFVMVFFEGAEPPTVTSDVTLFQ
jgi:hypothetical protein